MESLSTRVMSLIEQHDKGNIAEAARRTGVPYGTLYDLASGRSPNASRETLERVAGRYDVSVDYLLRGADTPYEGGLSQALSPAEHLIHVLSHPGLTDVLGRRVLPEDLVQGAYSIAFRERLPPEEMAKLDRWRDKLLSTTTSPAEPNAEHRAGS